MALSKPQENMSKKIHYFKPNLLQRAAYRIGIMKDPRYNGSKGLIWCNIDEVGKMPKTEILSNLKKTSTQWMQDTHIIMDPDGWDRTNFEFSFHKEEITKEEFQRRLNLSTVVFKEKS